MLVVGLDAVTSIMAGFTIFAIVGHMAYKLDQKVENVINQGLIFQQNVEKNKK